MKLAALTLGAAVAFGAVQAHAETMIEDQDASGTYSMEELQVAYPDLTEDGFAVIDASGDGEVDMEELAAAREAGVIAE
ncbi:EF-hand domain-containing protein [Primorskyibacter sedentarius]|uniref:EF-hand domain-containing protein n=1 Tax=Primorskyibacter sedentarius TaxID=745311 RepID=UPI003EBADC85